MHIFSETWEIEMNLLLNYSFLNALGFYVHICIEKTEYIHENKKLNVSIETFLLVFLGVWELYTHLYALRSIYIYIYIYIWLSRIYIYVYIHKHCFRQNH